MSTQPLYRRVINGSMPGTVQLTDDSGPVQKQQVQVGANWLHDSMPVLYHYGFSANPPPQTDTLTVFLGGDRSQGVVVGTNHQPSRFRGLAVGEVVVHDCNGQSIHITAAGIVITSPVAVTVSAPFVHITGDLHVDGDVLDHATTQAHTMANTRTIYDGHTHTDSRDGETSAPQQTM